MNILELKRIEEVKDYFEDLKEHKINEIAIDIECEMNLHCYGEHLCLIQIFDRKNKVIIDPLTFENKNDLDLMLKIVFESRDILKLTYDVAGDTSIIEKLYGVKYKSVFDLRPAVLLLEYEKQSLTNILNEELSVPLIQKKKFQTYNWMKRPIDPEALEYAISDVIYLFDLKDKLMDKIVAKGLLDRYMLLNLMAQNKDYMEPKPEDIYKKRKGYSKLPRWAKKRYKLFYDLREKYAKKTNKSPNALISNLDLLPLATNKVEVRNFLAERVTYRIAKEDRNDFVQRLTEAYYE